MYALIGYGDQIPGARPGTRLARLDDGPLVTWDGLAWVLHPFPRATLTVYATWDRCPDDVQVRHLQRLLPVVPPA